MEEILKIYVYGFHVSLNIFYVFICVSLCAPQVYRCLYGQKKTLGSLGARVMGTKPGYSVRKASS